MVYELSNMVRYQFWLIFPQWDENRIINVLFIKVSISDLLNHVHGCDLSMYLFLCAATM